MSLLHKKSDYRKVYKEHYGSIPKGMHIHHIDGNPLNNNIDNLKLVTPEEHTELHKNDFVKWASEGGKKGGTLTRDKKLGFHAWTKEQRIEQNKKLRHTDSVKKEQSERMKKLYANGFVHWTKRYSKEEVRKKMSEGQLNRNVK